MTPEYRPCPKPAPRAPNARKPLPKPTHPIGRTVAVKKRNAKRKGARFPHLRDDDYRAWIRRFACLIGQDCQGRIECAHVKSRGAGGADRGNCVPLCARHHRQQHDIGIQDFQAQYALDLLALARHFETLNRRWHDLQAPGGVE